MPARGEDRVCRTRTLRKRLKPRRISGGFAFSATLARASYKLTAVATDAAGNRSRTLTKTFRVGLTSDRRPPRAPGLQTCRERR